MFALGVFVWLMSRDSKPAKSASVYHTICDY